ncbi:unnamed protein product [Closterium sp. Naga37s-1]|nr:unnamed protein product [Closterium sp. Naga37s-1]
MAARDVVACAARAFRVLAASSSQRGVTFPSPNRDEPVRCSLSPPRLSRLPSFPPPVALISAARRPRIPRPSPSLPPPVALASPARRPRFPRPLPSLPPPVALVSPAHCPSFPRTSSARPPPVALASRSHRSPRRPLLTPFPAASSPCFPSSSLSLPSLVAHAHSPPLPAAVAFVSRLPAFANPHSARIYHSSPIPSPYASHWHAASSSPPAASPPLHLTFPLSASLPLCPSLSSSSNLLHSLSPGFLPPHFPLPTASSLLLLFSLCLSPPIPLLSLPIYPHPSPPNISGPSPPFFLSPPHPLPSYYLHRALAPSRPHIQPSFPSFPITK